ncbi:SMC-Scp complex subunit ScpB [uncultured Halomonas sp.]|uniref:SMC-Scp complex subunit ScpB n=1 Tax=uncultured Halomonas sp. TaxID=173971 RepID=UPI002616F14A|nr:SMC-Scp complex subunit ScpB [uncultured Halomonas sp.]
MMAEEVPGVLDEILEAALLAAGEPLAVERLEALFDDHERPPRRALREALERLRGRHERGAIELIETASGYQLRIRPRLSHWVSRLWDERPQRYSRALLETLALIAYRQPVTRGDIEEVRGVSVSGSIMRTLLERGWVRVVGHRDVPGRPAVYATTRSFLDDFGLKTLDELPPMHELKAFEGAEQMDAFDEEASPPDQTDILAQADMVQDEGAGEASEGATLSESEASAAADASNEPAEEGGLDHAEKASERADLSFADLEARLSERARSRVDEDAAAGAEYTSSENEDS